MKLLINLSRYNKYILSAALIMVLISVQQSFFETRLIAEQLLSVADFGQLTELDDEGLQRVYGIEPGMTDDYSAYISPSRISAERLLVIRVDHKRKRQQLLEKMELYGEKMENMTYLPDVARNVRQRVVCQQGNYILFAVCRSGAPRDVFDNIILAKKGNYDA